MYICDELITELKRNRVIPFIGAGVSMNLGLPSWGDIYKQGVAIPCLSKNIKTISFYLYRLQVFLYLFLSFSFLHVFLWLWLLEL